MRNAQGEVVDWQFLDVNPCAQALLAYHRDEVIGRPVSQIFGPETLARFSTEYARVLATGEPSVHETLYQDKYFLTTLFKMDEDTVASTGIDITDRKRAEETRAYQAMLLANVHDAVVATDANNIITLWNKNAERISGLSASEAMGKKFYEVVKRKDATLEEREADRRKIEENGILITEYTFLTRDGGPITLESVNIALRNPEGQLTGYLITSRDVTERKRMEQALKEREVELRKNSEALRQNSEALRKNSEALGESLTREHARAAELEALMNAVPAIIWVTHDPECRVMLGNQAGYEFLHMGPGQNLSKSAPAELVGPQPYEIMRDGQVIPPNELPMQITAATGKPVQDYEMDLVFDDGTTYHLVGNTAPLFDSAGYPSGAIGAFVDITALRRLQLQQIDALAQMEVQRRLMEYREKERQGIARDIHDGPIQTLSSTAFHIQFVKEAFSDPSLHLELEQISLNVKNTIRELRDILNDLRPPSLIRFGLTRAIRMHAEDLRERHPDMEIELDLTEESNRLSEQACLTLFRIYQEGMNNVVRHSGATKVVVVYHEDHDSFILELRDNGKGFQVSNDFALLTKEGHFGLAGMKERGETVGGDFSVGSQPGEGTTITVHGPLLGKNIK